MTYKIRTTTDPVVISVEKGQRVGGRTGSVRVDNGSDFYQYKPPISNNWFLRRKKSDSLDSENFGELLAARIAKAFDSDPNKPRVPDVSFVTSDNSRHLAIASKYLKGVNDGAEVQSLDKYLSKPPKRSHIKLVRGPTDRINGYYDINENPSLKTELAQAIALSALVGDHDVNPGNMIVVKEKNEQMRLGRIDYGHAFKDLMRHSNFGGKKTHNNNIIDFFNRATVDGHKAQSKLWRDYPGLTPSREMANALMAVANNKEPIIKIKAAIDLVRDEVEGLLNDVNIKIDGDQVIRSFQRIAEHVSGESIDPGLSSDEKIDSIFEKLNEYVQKNHKQMAYAGEVMSLQVSIQEAVNNGEDTKPLKAKYDLLFKNNDFGPFSWIKEAAKSPPFQGGFDEFVMHLKINRLAEVIDEFLNGDPAPSKHETAHARNLKAIVINPKKSVQDKVSLLEDRVRSLDDDPKPKSGLFSKLVDFVRNLFTTKPTQADNIGLLNPASKFTEFKNRLQGVVASEGKKVESSEETKQNVNRL